MPLRKDQIHRLAQRIGRKLKEGGIPLTVSEDRVVAEIESVVSRNFQEEVQIEREARETMARYQNQMQQGSVDPQKMFLMIKKQIAKDKNFIL